MKVMTKVLRFPTVLLLACSALAGCVSQPVSMYRLDNGTVEVPEQVDGAAVLLGPVVIADYLQRDVILQRHADGSLAEDAQAVWAGNLEQNVDQLLLRQLASRLDTQRLEMSPGSKGFTPEIQVELEITRLDSGPEHPAVLEAQWRLLDKDGKRQGGRLVRLQEEHQGSTADQVQAQSVLLQRLGEMLSDAIKPVLAKNAEKNRVARSPNKAEQTPSLAPIEAIRTDMEVFRF